MLHQQQEQQEQEQGQGQQQEQQSRQQDDRPLNAGTLLSPPRRRGAAPSSDRYPPVLKGDLALPGGPRWSALRRHVFAAGSDPDLPTIKAVIIVEGDQDQRAVAKAVNAPVYVCDGTRVLRSHALQELEALAALGRPLVVLTDPDERGRQLRGHLDAVLWPLLAARRPPGAPLHSFVPEPSAISAAADAHHAAGNRGIEHAVPRVLLAALRQAAPSRPAGAGESWDLERLQRAGLARAFDEGGGSSGSSGGGGGPGGLQPRERRRRLCALLGLGKCNGSQLAAALNKYFWEEQVAQALAAVDDWPTLGPQAGGAGAAGAPPPGGADEAWGGGPSRGVTEGRSSD